MTRLSLTLLGDFQARLGPGSPLRLRARKTQALLAYLALPAGQAHSRDKLAALLWGDRSPQHARSRLRETLFVLRRPWPWPIHRAWTPATRPSPSTRTRWTSMPWPSSG